MHCADTAQDAGIPVRPTLLVAPATLIYQWKAEIDKHVKPNVLSAIVYHGSDRHRVAHRSVWVAGVHLSLLPFQCYIPL